MNKKFMKLCKNKLEKLRNKYSNRVSKKTNYQHSNKEFEREITEQYIYSSSYIRNEAEKIINEIDRALIKMSKGLYGMCENTGRLIEPKRLIAIPYARYCNKIEEE